MAKLELTSFLHAQGNMYKLPFCEVIFPKDVDILFESNYYRVYNIVVEIPNDENKYESIHVHYYSLLTGRGL